MIESEGCGEKNRLHPSPVNLRWRSTQAEGLVRKIASTVQYIELNLTAPQAGFSLPNFVTFLVPQFLRFRQKNGLNSNRKTAHYLLHPERRLHLCRDAIKALVSIS